jgi:hypothetical protein
MSSKSGSLFCPRDKEMQQLMNIIIKLKSIYRINGNIKDAINHVKIKTSLG